MFPPAELRKLAWAGIPNELRPMSWQLLLVRSRHDPSSSATDLATLCRATSRPQLLEGFPPWPENVKSTPMPFG